MHHVDLIVGEHGIEEIRKGGNQTRPQGVGKIWDLGSYPVDGEVGRGLGRRSPAFIEDGGRAKLTLPRPSAGAADGGGQGGDTVSSLFPSSLEPWRWEGGEVQD